MRGNGMRTTLGRVLLAIGVCALAVNAGCRGGGSGCDVRGPCCGPYPDCAPPGGPAGPGTITLVDSLTKPLNEAGEGLVISFVMSPERTTRVEIPGQYVPTPERVMVFEGGWFEENGRTVYKDAQFETVTKFVPPRYEMRTVAARAATLHISPDFGKVKHVYFIHSWDWDLNKDASGPLKMAVRPETGRDWVWDLGTEKPPIPPWTDLTGPSIPVRAKMEGWLIVTGDKGASGPKLIDLLQTVGGDEIVPTRLPPGPPVPEPGAPDGDPAGTG